MIVDKCTTLLHSDVIVSYSTVQISAYLIDQSTEVGIFSNSCT